MQDSRFAPDRRRLLARIACAGGTGAAVFMGSRRVLAQQPAAAVAVPQSAQVALANRVLAGLKPATSVDKLLAGNEVLLEFRSVARAGVNRVRIVSGMPRTDALWLFTLSPAPDAGGALLASAFFETGTKPEATFFTNLEHTQPLLAMVRSGGLYYGVIREIKIGKPV
jgi:hypothetical protein